MHQTHQQSKIISYIYIYFFFTLTAFLFDFWNSNADFYVFFLFSSSPFYFPHHCFFSSFSLPPPLTPPFLPSILCLEVSAKRASFSEKTKGVNWLGYQLLLWWTLWSELKSSATCQNSASAALSEFYNYYTPRSHPKFPLPLSPQS